jgi:site-specific DNA recombinase
MNALGYCRISDKDQSVYSIDSQKRTITEYCKRNNLNLVEIFTDEGESSYTFDRPDWEKLEAHLKKKKDIQYLIVYDLDRFSRNLAEALVKIKELQNKYDVKVLATTDSIDTDFADPSVFMMRAFKLMMAEGELHRIRQRTKSGMHQAALSGRYVSRAPWGFINTRDAEGKPLLIIDEERAIAIRLIFKEYNRGKGIEEIKKIITPLGFKLSGNSAIQHILSNPLYAGLIRVPAHKGNPETIQRAVHRGIVSEGEYWSAQEKLSAKKSTRQKNEEVPLRGVVRCHLCGNHMTAGNSKGRQKYYWYYLCPTHRKGFPAGDMHRKMNRILDLLSFDEETIERFKKDISENIKIHIGERSEIIARTTKYLRGVQDKISHAEEKHLLEPVSQATYNRVINKLRSQQVELERRLLELDLDEDQYWDQVKRLLPKLHDIRGTIESLDLVSQQAFIRLVFNDSYMYDGEVYRTTFLDPLFAHNALVLKEEGLLVIEQSSIKNARTPISAPDRS